MQQELKIPEQESNIDIKIGDMFMWTRKAHVSNIGRKIIYLGRKVGAIEIPINKHIDSSIGVWTGLSKESINEYIHNGEIERLPKGTTFTITQE